jgi:hypothetical protein
MDKSLIAAREVLDDGDMVDGDVESKGRET